MQATVAHLYIYSKHIAYVHFSRNYFRYARSIELVVHYC
jgi:hypothetical protein